MQFSCDSDGFLLFFLAPPIPMIMPDPRWTGTFSCTHPACCIKHTRGLDTDYWGSEPQIASPCPSRDGPWGHHQHFSPGSILRDLPEAPHPQLPYPGMQMQPQMQTASESSPVIPWHAPWARNLYLFFLIKIYPSNLVSANLQIRSHGSKPNQFLRYARGYSNQVSL